MQCESLYGLETVKRLIKWTNGAKFFALSRIISRSEQLQIIKRLVVQSDAIIAASCQQLATTGVESSSELVAPSAKAAPSSGTGSKQRRSTRATVTLSSASASAMAVDDDDNDDNHMDVVEEEIELNGDDYERMYHVANNLVNQLSRRRANANAALVVEPIVQRLYKVRRAMLDELSSHITQSSTLADFLHKLKRPLSEDMRQSLMLCYADKLDKLRERINPRKAKSFEYELICFDKDMVTDNSNEGEAESLVDKLTDYVMATTNQFIYETIKVGLSDAFDHVTQDHFEENVKQVAKAWMEDFCLLQFREEDANVDDADMFGAPSLHGHDKVIQERVGTYFTRYYRGHVTPHAAVSKEIERILGEVFREMLTIFVRQIPSNNSSNSGSSNSVKKKKSKVKKEEANLVLLDLFVEFAFDFMHWKGSKKKHSDDENDEAEDPLRRLQQPIEYGFDYLLSKKLDEYLKKRTAGWCNCLFGQEKDKDGRSTSYTAVRCSVIFNTIERSLLTVRTKAYQKRKKFGMNVNNSSDSEDERRGAQDESSNSKVPAAAVKNIVIEHVNLIRNELESVKSICERLQQQCNGEDGMQLLSYVERLVALDKAAVKRPSDFFSKFSTMNRQGTLSEKKRHVAAKADYFALQIPNAGPLTRDFMPSGVINTAELRAKYGLKIHLPSSSPSATSSSISTSGSLFHALSHQLFFQDDDVNSHWLRRALVYTILLNYDDNQEPRAFEEETGMSMFEWEEYMSCKTTPGDLFVLQRFVEKFGFIIDVFVGGSVDDKPIRLRYADAEKRGYNHKVHFNLGWNAGNNFVSLVPVEWVKDRPPCTAVDGEEEKVEDILPPPPVSSANSGGNKRQRQQQRVSFSNQNETLIIPSRRPLTFVIFDTCSLILHAQYQPDHRRISRGILQNLVFPFDRNHPVDAMNKGPCTQADRCFVPLAVMKELQNLKGRVDTRSSAGHRCNIRNDISATSVNADLAIREIEEARRHYSQPTVHIQDQGEYDRHCHMQKSQQLRGGDNNDLTIWNDRLFRRAVEACLLNVNRVILVSDDRISTRITEGNGEFVDVLLTVTYRQYVELSHNINFDLRLQPMESLRVCAKRTTEERFRF